MNDFFTQKPVDAAVRWAALAPLVSTCFEFIGSRFGYI